MSGDAGNDVFSGGAGDDAILARDGERDIVQCGLGGADRAIIDAGLDEVRGCEIVG
jgi:Ca2+-binding RTX toxin-like protein